MWVEDLEPGQPWTGVWHNLISCGNCRSLFCAGPGALCHVCGWDCRERQEMQVHILKSGEAVAVPPIMMGAIDWTTFVLLGLMQREWERPQSPGDRFDSLPPEKRPAQRLAIVLLFWSLFEHLMERFFEDTTRELPIGVRGDLLKRYSSIGSRLDRLYRVLFAVSFHDDLTRLGYADVSAHLMHVHGRRNQFVHGDPESIDDAVVHAAVKQLPRVHEAWIALYNARCTRCGQPRDAHSPRPGGT